MNDKPPERSTLTAGIRGSLRAAESNAHRLRRSNTWLLVAGIVCSAATTLVTAATAAQGPILGEGPAGWRTTCWLAAALGFATTVCVGLNQQLRLADRLSRSQQCAGKLRALDVAMSVGSRNSDEVATEYEEVVRSFPEALRSRA